MTIAIGLAAVIAAVIASIGTRAAFAQQYTVDRSASDKLTSYLRHHRLPLVGAQVLTAADGGRRLVLYGFVATDFGRKNAESNVTWPILSEELKNIREPLNDVRAALKRPGAP